MRKRALWSTAATVAVLAGCAAPPAPVVTGQDLGHTATAPEERSAGPLAVADLPGWGSADRPWGTLGQVCDQASPLAGATTDVTQSTVISPTGITVTSQISTYENTDVVSLISKDLPSYVVTCPVATTDASTTVVTPLRGAGVAGGSKRIHDDLTSGVRTVTIHLIDVLDTGRTVEVEVSAPLPPNGDTSGVEEFAWDVLDTARDSANGDPVTAPPSPPLPVPDEADNGLSDVTSGTPELGGGGGSLTDAPPPLEGFADPDDLPF